MQKELLKQAMQLFDSADKWNSFLELSDSKYEIRNQWYQKLITHVTKWFLEEDKVNGWSFETLGAWDYRWYLTEFGRDSFCICMNQHQIGLWVDYTFFNSQRITDLLKEETYSMIMTTLRPDVVFSGDWKLIEYGNFNFDSPYDGHFDLDRLGWFAGNKTEEFVNQLSEKINKFRKDETITKLFAELNREAKR